LLGIPTTWIRKEYRYFQNQGFYVVHACHFAPAMQVPHPNLGSAVNPAEQYEWVHKHAQSDMDGVFIAGNGWSTIGVIATLEEDLGRPVLTANQASFWYALQQAGVGAQVDDYGQVFKKSLPQGTKMTASERLRQKSA